MAPVNAKCVAASVNRFGEDLAGSDQEDFARSRAPNSADSRPAADCTSLARLCSTWSVMRQIGPEMPSAPITSPVKL